MQLTDHLIVPPEPEPVGELQAVEYIEEADADRLLRNVIKHADQCDGVAVQAACPSKAACTV